MIVQKVCVDSEEKKCPNADGPWKPRGVNGCDNKIEVATCPEQCYLEFWRVVVKKKKGKLETKVFTKNFLGKTPGGSKNANFDVFGKLGPKNECQGDWWCSSGSLRQTGEAWYIPIKKWPKKFIKDHNNPGNKGVKRIRWGTGPKGVENACALSSMCDHVAFYNELKRVAQGRDGKTKVLKKAVEAKWDCCDPCGDGCLRGYECSDTELKVSIGEE